MIGEAFAFAIEDAGIGEHFGVVEGESRLGDAFHDPCIVGVIAALEGAADDMSGVADRDGVALEIAIGSGVDANELIEADVEPSLLKGFADCRLLDGFIVLDKSAGERPMALVWGVSAFDEDDAVFVMDDHIDGDGSVVTADA